MRFCCAHRSGIHFLPLRERAELALHAVNGLAYLHEACTRVSCCPRLRWSRCPFSFLWLMHLRGGCMAEGGSVRIHCPCYVRRHCPRRVQVLAREADVVLRCLNCVLMSFAQMLKPLKQGQSLSLSGVPTVNVLLWSAKSGIFPLGSTTARADQGSAARR